MVVPAGSLDDAPPNAPREEFELDSRAAWERR
jgi:hypothetical protein